MNAQIIKMHDSAKYGSSMIYRAHTSGAPIVIDWPRLHRQNDVRYEVSLCLGSELIDKFGVSNWRFKAVMDDFGTLVKVNV